MTAPTKVQRKSGTIFRALYVCEMHPPQSGWLLDAVPLFCGAGLDRFLAGNVTRLRN